MQQMIEKFKKGTQYVNIQAAATAEELTAGYRVSDDFTKLKCIKFIPASGAATRMFKDLYQYLEDGVATVFVRHFFENLERFAFYGEILPVIEAEGIDKSEAEGKKRIVEMVLADKLNYGNLPKALIKMHAYGNQALTPIDEHIYEGEHYLNSDDIQLHFTISPDHEALFKDYVSEAVAGKDQVTITYSFQKKSTDTLAVDPDNKPFLDENGEPLYRAGGHGSLIENLNDLDGDIIFIKNIDNVCHRDRVAATIASKKTLASIGYRVKKQVDAYIKALLAEDYDLDEINSFIENTLNITGRLPMTKEAALSFLNRPLRVCGMVKNEGEPGGGPFIVDNGTYSDLQICEMSELDLKDAGKVAILEGSQFFNPVDLICFVRDYEGNKFNLLDYTNPDRYFISEKSYKGRPLKALEHPGLWNGAMHNWNTLFVEVPLATFNPVKTVNDLLREGHQAV